MLSCQEVLSELGDYLDDGLTEELRRALEEHLAHCVTCEVLYDSARKTLRIVTDSGSFDLPSTAVERISREVMKKLGLGSTTGGDREG